MEPPASSRLLEGNKFDETKQRLWHKRVLEVIKKLELWTCEWNSASTVASELFERENHSRYTVVSMDVAAFCLDGGALSVRPKNETDSV